MSYKTIQDAVKVTGDDRYKKGRTRIWYQKQKYFRDLNFGLDFLSREEPHLIDMMKDDISQTHIELGQVAETDPEEIFQMMQAMFWSPNGEARSLIQGKGLGHTSMSVGDAVQIGSDIYFVDNIGFKKISSRGSQGLKKQLIRLGSDKPSLRKHLRPILDKISGKVATSLQDDKWPTFVDKTRDAVKEALGRGYFQLQRGAGPLEDVTGDYILFELFASAGDLRQALLSLDKPVADYAPKLMVSFKQQSPQVFEVEVEAYNEMEGVLGKTTKRMPSPLQQSDSFVREMTAAIKDVRKDIDSYAERRIQIWYEDHQ